MALSNDLISQFVKITKDKQDVKKETVVYGTIQKNDNGNDNYVNIDGSNISTPVAKTVVANDGDRVTVMIKNHTATVTGNLSNPSARKIDTVDINNLNASNARIDSLEAANVKVQNTLTANNADIENLKAADVEITGRVTANEAEIEHLKALDIDVEKLEAAYAFVEDLEASHADVDYLVSTVAEIDNLIFGSASGDVIQTSFSNAVIAQLGDAQIKSAMIENISADKITSGNIITNNVRVMSEDGSLIISDETLQISDSNRVRVQIGKDAANDYSINIWDQNGNLMFSKGGITDAAIKEAIIRNDMVSDTANIHASKLDIDSLFEEINDSSNTIKSTKVYLDDKKQTLDVAFKTLTTDVTNQGKTITSQGTAISTIQGQISSKVWQQDINTAKNEMSTQYSTLEQEVDSFKTTVSETYATVSDLNNLEIGGRNFARNTSETPTTYKFSGWQIYLDNNITVSNKILPYIVNNQEITISAYINNITGEEDVGLMINIDTPETVNGYKQIVSEEKIAPGESGWVRCTRKLTDVGTQGTSTGVRLALRHYSGTAGASTASIHSLKLELGNLATGWIPAPEDIDTEITNLDARILSAESSITQLTNKITANVTETTNLGTRMTTVEQTADSLSVELENIEIGGRNLLKNSKLVAMYSNNSNVYPISCVETTENGVAFYRVKRTNIDAYPSTVLSMYSTLHKDSFMYGHMTGKQVTLSFKARVSHEIAGTFMDFTYGGDSVVDFGKSNETFTTDWKTYYVTIDSFPDMTNHTGIRWCPRQFQLTEDILEEFYLDIRDFKFELGNKPTDWSPAPEDVESDILNASKTATNYLSFSSSGLVIGDMTASTLGKNVLIDSDSVDIRNGNTTLASFGADYLYLAKNSRNAKIDLCNGLATLYHESKYSYDTMFIIDTGNTTEIMGLITPLCVTSTDDLDNVSIQFANANGVMGGIGIIGSYLRRFGSNMYDNYIILDTNNFDDVMDSGWLTAIPASGFTLYNTSQPIQYRKIGKIVSLNGTVSPMTEIAGSTTTYTICTLPEGYRPSRSRYFVCYGSNNYTWRLTINTSGAVQFSRYGLDSGYVTAGTNHWLNFNVTFFTD